MATSYESAVKLSKMKPKKVLDIMMKDNRVDNAMFRRIALYAGVPLEELFRLDHDKQRAYTLNKKELVAHLYEEKKKRRIYITPLLMFIPVSVIAWYVQSEEGREIRKHVTERMNRNRGKRDTVKHKGGKPDSDTEKNDIGMKRVFKKYFDCMLQGRWQFPYRMSCEDREILPLKSTIRKIMFKGQTLQKNQLSIIRKQFKNAVAIATQQCSDGNNECKAKMAAEEFGTTKDKFLNTLTPGERKLMAADITPGIFGNMATDLSVSISNVTDDAIESAGTKMDDAIVNVGTVMTEQQDNFFKRLNNIVAQNLGTTGVIIGLLTLFGVSLKVWQNKNALKKEKELHDYKLEQNRRQAVFLQNIKKQASVLHKLETSIEPLKKYKNQLVYVAPLVTMALVYATLKSKQQQSELYEVLYVKQKKTVSTVDADYAQTNALKRIDKRLHQLFLEHAYNPSTAKNDSLKDGGITMQELRYKLIIYHLQYQSSMRATHLYHVHFFDESGHLYNTPGDIAHSIKKHHRFWNVFRNIPRALTNKLKKTQKQLLGRHKPHFKTKNKTMKNSSSSQKHQPE